MQYCSLQHWTLLPSADTSRTGHHFHFASDSSFFLRLSLCSSPVTYWTPTNLGGHLSFSVIAFCLFILFIAFSGQEYWSGLPFSSPVDHVLLGTDVQGHALWPLHIAGGYAWCPGCPTAGLRWACKPSLAVGCQSACGTKSRHTSLA